MVDVTPPPKHLHKQSSSMSQNVAGIARNGSAILSKEKNRNFFWATPPATGASQKFFDAQNANLSMEPDLCRQVDMNLNRKQKKKSVTFEEEELEQNAECLLSPVVLKERSKNVRAYSEDLPSSSKNPLQAESSAPNFHIYDLMNGQNTEISGFDDDAFSPPAASTPSSTNQNSSSSYRSKEIGSPTEGQRSISREKRAQSFAVSTPGPSCVALRDALLTLYRLDDFDREYLAEGFFSDVYKVRHKTSGEIMVLKISKPETSQKANILKEVQLMKRLRHQNVVQFKGVCVDYGNLHALTEFCNAGSLDRLILHREKKFSWRLRASLALDIARGMEYAHSMGFMHRDLTAMNVLLKRTGYVIRALVADFGLSCKIPNGEKLDQVGTPYWMAPECLKEEYYDEKADVFSYGLICCQMIARIDADPEKGIPRTPAFGLDYVMFGEKCPEDTPDDMLLLAFSCCAMDPVCRPGFDMIVKRAFVVYRGIQGQARSRSKPWSMTQHTQHSRISRSYSDAGLSVSKDGVRQKERGNKSLAEVDLLSRKTSELAQTGPDRKTSRMLAQSVAEKDPFYEPGPDGLNPFAEHEKFKDGRKIPLPKTPERFWSSSFDEHCYPDGGGSVANTPEDGLAQFEPQCKQLCAPLNLTFGGRQRKSEEISGNCRKVVKMTRCRSLPCLSITSSVLLDPKRKSKMTEIFRDSDQKFASRHYPNGRQRVSMTCPRDDVMKMNKSCDGSAFMTCSMNAETADTNCDRKSSIGQTEHFAIKNPVEAVPGNSQYAYTGSRMENGGKFNGGSSSLNMKDTVVYSGGKEPKRGCSRKERCSIL